MTGEDQSEANPTGSADGSSTDPKGERAPNPTVELSIGSTLSTAHTGGAETQESASPEGDNPAPFASTTITQSQTASSHGADSEKSAPTVDSDSKILGDDLWAIPSRASHYS